MGPLTRIGVLAAMVGVAGCGYFQPVEPEIPTRPPLHRNYSHPDSSLETMNTGLADKSSEGGDTYLSALAESTSISTPGFHQLFWPEDIVTWGGLVPGDWDRLMEQRLYSSLIGLRPTDAYRLRWSDGQTTDDIDFINGVGHIQRRYRVVTYVNINVPGGDSTIIAIGYADLDFWRDPQGNWRVIKWTDKSDPEADSGDQQQITLGRRRLLSQSD
jgi:hypothetical protein